MKGLLPQLAAAPVMSRGSRAWAGRGVRVQCPPRRAAPARGCCDTVREQRCRVASAAAGKGATERAQLILIKQRPKGERADEVQSNCSCRCRRKQAGAGAWGPAGGSRPVWDQRAVLPQLHTGEAAVAPSDRLRPARSGQSLKRYLK